MPVTGHNDPGRDVDNVREAVHDVRIHTSSSGCPRARTGCTPGREMPVRSTLALRVALLTIAALAAQLTHARAADEPSLDTVLKRVAAYVDSYVPQLATIVAEERYRRWMEADPHTVVLPGPDRTRREIRSDFALMLLDDGETWVALRDAFEVDGSPLRDHEDRLVQLLSKGDDQALRQAGVIADESARLTLATRVIPSKITVPTFVIQLMQARHRERFRFSRVKLSDARGADKTKSTQTESTVHWAVEFLERARPTLVRQATGDDQPLRGTMIVDPQTGEVFETHLTWERGPRGTIDVTFGRVPEVAILVPVRMTDQYRDAQAPLTLFGDAVYSRFRRFTTSSRVITGEAPPTSGQR
jgi:hypothetical protein